MSNIVRRVMNGDLMDAKSGEGPPAVPHRGHRIAVVSQLTTGVNQKLVLGWQVPPQDWARGFVLRGFRSNVEFAHNIDTRNLSEHGHMIIEKMEDGSQEEHLPEGTYYYTFILAKRKLFGCVEARLDIVRFSETIPTAKLAIGRIEDKVKLNNLLRQDELGDVNHQIAMMDAAEKLEQRRRTIERRQHQPNTAEQDAGEVMARKKLAEMRSQFKSWLVLEGGREQLAKEFRKTPEYKRLGRDKREQFEEMLRERVNGDEEAFQP